MISSLARETLVTSDWTKVELTSTLSKLFRMGRISKAAALIADLEFTAILDETFTIILPGADDFELARLYVKTFETNLRAGDALHLACAKNLGANTIYSFDKVFIEAGKVLGLPTSLPGDM